MFDTEGTGKPTVGLRNNDGGAIGRYAEARARGIKMGQPAHELKNLVRENGLLMRSANFTLYGDYSERVVSILRDQAPRVEVYSIDESFIDLAGIRDRVAFCRALRQRIRLWTGIPNCIGIGPTKTLAKLANKLAKKGAGVVDVTESAAPAAALEPDRTEDLCGVGRR